MGYRMSLPGKRLLAILLLLVLYAAGGCRKSSWSLWDSYSAQFIDSTGRLFDHKGDRHTTTEGQAYALMRDQSTGLYGKELTYNDQNLALFATGFLDGRFRFGPGGELNIGWMRL